MAWVADLMRYHLLERFGGIYLDTDIVAIRSLLPFLTYSAFTVCEVSFERTKHFSRTSATMPSELCSRACNAVIGAKPYHPALQQAKERSMENTLKAFERDPEAKFNVRISGPPQWTDVAKKYGEVVFLRSYTFYPCAWHRKQDCIKEKYLSDKRVFAMHTWAESWRK